ncbi:MAG: hypothetical protein HYY18_03605 [Planctomycetes bacterium]|nr:hypothetical protein [Planctomycetota bacterium]
MNGGSERGSTASGNEAASRSGGGSGHRALAAWGLASAALIFVLGACQVYNWDVGQHLAKGRWIVEHRELPRPEQFTACKRPGFLYQDRWLFQAGTWIVYRAGGWTGLTLVKIAFLWLTFALLWAAARPAGPAACAVATLCAALLMYERWDIRSELSIYLVLAATLALVTWDGRPGRALWAMPAVVAVGINLHALSILAPCVLAGAAAVAMLRAEGRAHARTWALATAGSFAAVLLNPQGWRVVKVPFEYLARYRSGPEWYRGWITELAGVTETVTWSSASLVAVWIVVPLAAAALALNWRRLRTFDLGVLAVGALAAFSYRRNISIAGVLLFPVIARNLHEAAAAWAAPRRAGLAAAAALGAAFALTAALSSSDLWATWERSSRRSGFGVCRTSLPVHACDFLDREGFTGNAFTNWDAGNYYTLRRFPASVPTMNGEGDWNLENLEEYDRVTRLAEPFDAYAARYGLEIAFMTHQSADTRALAAWLARSPAWALVWRDEVAVVFARRDGANAGIVKRLGPASAPDAGAVGSPGGLWPWGEGARRAAAIRAYRMGTLRALFEEEEQLGCYEKALQLWPGYPEAHNNLGTYFAKKRDGRAGEEFREAVRLAPRYVPARRNLARWLLERGDAPGAVRELEAGLDEIESADLLVDLAELLAARGDAASLERAKSLARRALELRPGHVLARRLLDRLGP